MAAIHKMFHNDINIKKKYLNKVKKYVLFVYSIRIVKDFEVT